jgi:hypothetical protein
MSFHSDDPPSSSTAPGGRKRPGDRRQNKRKPADFKSSDWYERAARRFSISGGGRASDAPADAVGDDDQPAGDDDASADPRDGGPR